MGVYRLSMPLTASKTAVATIAVTRVETTGLVLAVSTVCNIIVFQSVTTSAFDRLGVMMPITNTSAVIRTTAELQNRLPRLSLLLSMASIGNLLFAFELSRD